MARTLYGGHCRCCQTEHFISDSEQARDSAQQLLTEMLKAESLDIFSATPDPRFSTAPLWGQARGKMFGILLCQDHKGQPHTLRAFSGQYNGFWHIPGWAPPLFSSQEYDTLERKFEPTIKSLSHKIALCPAPAERQRRKKLSQQWMSAIQDLYRVHNFKGECRSLALATPELSGIPTGTGDCCAPKLLNQAAQMNLQPLALSEFYFGRSNRSQTKQHGYYYPSCPSRCAHLLGYMLCGVNNNE